MGRNDKLFQKRKAASAESLRRRAAFRHTNVRVLIVCEGEKTERMYFEALVASLDLGAVDVEITSEGGAAPRSVVEHAEQRARAEGAEDDAGYNAVFCVFDRDTHETFEEARERHRRLRADNVFPKECEVAVTSNPSIEYWFLLHFRFLRAPIVAGGGETPGQRAVRLLREVPEFRSYQKKLSKDQLAQLLKRTEVAIRHAKAAAADARATNEENPSTEVYRVVEFLVGLKK